VNAGRMTAAIELQNGERDDAIVIGRPG